MADIRGRKAKFANIPAPIGQKIIGQIVEVKLSEKFEDCISVKIEFPQLSKPSDDGSKTFTKKGFYVIPLNWSPKNKAGRLHESLTGRLPSEDEDVNWTKLLLGRKVACVFETVFDKNSGEPDGDKICWMGSPTGNVQPTPKPHAEREIQMDDPPEFEDGDDLPEHIKKEEREAREPGDEHLPL